MMKTMQSWRFDGEHLTRISLADASEAFYRRLAYGMVATGSQQRLGPLAAALRCKGVPVERIIDHKAVYWFIQSAWFRPRKCRHEGCNTLVRRGNLLRGFCDVHAEDASSAAPRPLAVAPGHMSQRKKTVIDILRDSPGFVSGEAMSVKLGISRNSVHKHVRSLRSQGYRILGIPRRGYRIEEEPCRPAQS